MTESFPTSQPPQKLSFDERLSLMQVLNKLPLTQMLMLEYALNVPAGIMPGTDAAQGLRTRALLDWVDSPSGIELPKFFQYLEKATGISLEIIRVNSPLRFTFTIKGTIDQANAAFLLEILTLLREKADDPLIEIASISRGSIRLNLQGSPEGLRRLAALASSGELELLGLDAKSAILFFDLIRANLSNARLSETDFRGAYLSGANLSGTNLSGANLSGANLIETHLSGADLSFASLRGAYLSIADLRGAYLIHANFRDAILIRTHFSHANLSHADLSHANLSVAFLRDANLSDADLKGANLVEAYFHLADLSDANLSGANLSGANLVGTNLVGTNLVDAAVVNTFFGDNSGLTEQDKGSPLM